MAYASLIRGAAKTMALYDIDRDKVRAEVLNLNDGSRFYPTANVIGSDDIAVTADSDIVVITAGAKQKPVRRAAVTLKLCASGPCRTYPSNTHTSRSPAGCASG